MSRIALLLCAVLLFVTPAFAQECNSTYAWYFTPTYTCDRSNTEGPCALSQPVSFATSSYPWAPVACGTTSWSFGDGTNATTSGNEPVSHTYATPGTYSVVATVTVAATASKSKSAMTVTVANGFVLIHDLELQEGASGQIRMTRTNVTDPIQVPWSLTTEGGATPTDITPVAGVATFAAGQATSLVNVQSLDDATFAPAASSRTYEIVPGAVTGGFLATTAAQVLVFENDYPVVDFAVDPIDTSETAGFVTVPVARVGGDPNAPFSVNYEVFFSSGIAVPTSGTLAFGPGQMSRSFNVVLNDDQVFTGTRQFTVRLNNPTNGAKFPPDVCCSNTATVRVADDETPPHISVSDVVVTEGDDGVTQVSIAFTGPLIDNFASYTVSSTKAKRGVDYTGPVNGNVYLGYEPRQINLQIIGDREAEQDEVITVALRLAFSSGSTIDPLATVTILNDDAGLGPDRLQIPRGSSSTLVLNIGNPAVAPLIVPLSTNRPDLVGIPATITIPAGQSRATFEATGLVSDGTFFTITAGLPADRGGPQSIQARVYEPLQLTFDPAVVNVVEGQEIPVRVLLTPDDATRELALHVAHSTIASAPSSVTVDRGVGTFLLEGLKAGTTIITMVNPDGSDAESVLEVNVVAPGDTPSIASISPATGPAAGGTSFVATGAHLTGNCTLSFGGVPVAEVTLVDGTLTGVTPAHPAGTVDVALTCGSQHFVLTNGFTYVAAPPTLASIAPSFGSTAGGTLVHATGTNFQSGCWMFFGGQPATSVTVDSTTSLTAATPPRDSAGAVEAIVRCSSASSSPVSFAYSSAVEPSASIISIDPLIGAPGESVTVTGSRFRADDRFRFDDVNATILRTRSNEHVLRIPELPLGLSSITHTDVAGRATTTGPIFLIVEPVPPRVTSVEPANTLPGSEIALLGTGFRPAYSFAIGGHAAEIVSLTSERAIVRLANDVAPGMHPVHVLNAAGRIASIGAPVIVGSSTLRVHGAFPECGSTDGGTVVTITGIDFAPGATITFNGVAATNVELVAPNTLRATTPAGPTGPATLVVVNPTGDTATITSAFRYVSPFDPNGGCGGGRQRGVRK